MIKPITIKLISLTIFVFSNTIKSELNVIDSLSDLGIHNEAFMRAEQLYKKNPANIDVICKMAATTFLKAQNEKSISKQKDIFYRGFDYAKNALKLDSLHGYANFWYAAYIGRIGEIEGIRQSIINSYHVEEYGLKAINLISEDYDAVHHLMGRWHYELADLSQLERVFASLIYEKPPNGSYKQAIYFFNNAINIKPDEIRNHYWLGKAYNALGESNLAKKEFKIVLSLNPKDIDDKRMQSEAHNLLN